MLKDFVANKRVKLNAVLGFYPASAVGDDIEVYEDESRTVVKAKMYGLRQQVRKRNSYFAKMLVDKDSRRGVIA